MILSLLLSLLISNAEITSTANKVNQGTGGSSAWLTSRNWLLTSLDIVNIGNFPANQTVSGTVTANQGTSPWLTSRNWLLTSSDIVTANAGTNLNTSALDLESTQSAFKSANHTDLLQINTTLGSPMQNSGGSVTANIGTTGGLALASNQTTANTTLSTIATNTTGISTSANQTNGTQKSQIVDGANATIGPVQTISGTNYLPVVQSSSGTPGSAVPARSTIVAGSDGTNVRTLSTDTSGNQNINIVSPLTSNGNLKGSVLEQGLVSGTGTSSALSATPIPATDASQYQCLKFQVTGTSTQTLTMEGSGDNASWLANSFKDTSAVTSAAQSTIVNTAGESTFYMPVNVRYVRLISTAYTSGTMTVTYQFTTLPCSFDIGTHAVGSTVVTLAAGILSTQATTTDIASAARTTTFTSASINQSQGSQSASIAISVTAVSGTNPTMDCILQESNDTGTTFYDAYHWERITATGVYQSPVMRWTGNRVKYICTIAGTTPSFTFSGIRVDTQNPSAYRKRFFDRTLAPNSSNSTTAAYYTEGCNSYNFTTNISACTTFPTVALQLSEDSSNWATTTDSLGLTANGTNISASVNYNAKFSRLIVTTPGTTCTNNYVSVSCSGR